MAELDAFKRIHIVGAGGAGMSGLAKILGRLGYEITGSDLKSSEALHTLSDLGLQVWSGSRPEEAVRADLVVASSAVPDEDLELTAARAAGVEVWRRPQLLRALTARMPAVGATGTHGKTTSTALMVAALRAAGRDPSYVVGGELTDLRSNAHLGEEDLFVLEADEAFGTFLELHLRGLLVTNVEPDHMDHYGTVDRLEDAFAQVVRAVKGPVVIGADDPGARRLAERTRRPTFGLASNAEWRITDLEEGGAAVRFVLRRGSRSLPVEVGRPGVHVARNAAGVLALLEELGFDPGAGAAGLVSFAGVKRRFEVRGTVEGVTIIDDYAHHPSEVAATLRAARRGEWHRIWAVFQPHLYSRTAELYREFGPAFSEADEAVITDVFGSREAPRPGVTGALVADAIRAATRCNVSYVPHRSDLARFLVGRLRPGDLVVTMGAGDITLVPDELAAELAGGMAP